MGRGRPPMAVASWECHVHLRLRTGQDDDLIEFLRALPPRKRVMALKSALRAGGMAPNRGEGGVVDDETLSAIDDFLK